MTGVKKERLLSLDVFRGVTVFLMIVVNTAGPGAEPFGQLVHAKWFGFTLADLIFPTFLFVVGNALSFAIRPGMDDGAFIRRVFQRSALIFLLGFLMYWYPFFTVDHATGEWAWKPFSETRVPGVLQRIALCYLLAAPIARWCRPRTIVLACVALVLGYWATLLVFSGVGGPYDKLTNAGTRLDLTLLNPAHLYSKDGGFDPEGFLGTLPATANVLAGFLAGRWVKQKGASLSAMLPMAGIGAALVVVALVWAPYFPVAKKLWTGSFVALTVGIDLMLLAAFVALYDMWKLRVGSDFFGIFGRNPLAIYLFSELLVTTLFLIPVAGREHVWEWIGVDLFQRVVPGPVGSLLCAVAYTLVCWMFGRVLDRKGWFLRV